mmetsp:Transcript_21167/g.50069  ORF Transcript_21167/g.50069 Transcript_21167/m.50069 type:complete len:361 (-) Transcript_21167:100-1182(-)
MHRVADHRHRALAPALEERGRAVIEVALLDGVFGSRVQDLEDLLAPAALLALAEEVVEVLSVRGAALRPRRQRQERVPLRAAAAHVRGHKVLARPDVDLVADIEVVVGALDGVSGKAGVARVGGARVRPLGVLVPHLGADRRPDAIGSDEHVSLHAAAILEVHLDGAILELLPVLHGRVAQHGVIAANFVQQELLEVWAVDHARVRELEVLGHLGDGVELGVPLRADAVLDPVGARPRERELLHQLREHVLVDRLDRRQCVRSKLNRSAKPGKLASLLQDSDLDALLLECLGKEQPPNTTTRHDHLQRILGSHSITSHLKGCDEAPPEGKTLLAGQHRSLDPNPQCCLARKGREARGEGR